MAAEDLDDETFEEDDEKPARRLPLKWIIIGASALLILIAGGLTLWFLMGDDTPPAEQTAPDQQAASQSEKAGIGADEASFQLLAMEPLVVTLSDSAQKHYLKIGLSLEYIDTQSASELEELLPQLQDAFIIALSAKTRHALSGVDDKLDLKLTLIRTVNNMLKQGRIRDLYITQFILQ